MRSPTRFLIAGAVILIAPLVLLRACGGPSPSQRLAEHEAARAEFVEDAERRGQFIDGYQAMLDVRMMVDHYYFEHWSLPPTAEHLSHRLPTPAESGPTRYSFDPEDGAIVMFFEGREGIADGQVGLTPEIDEQERKLEWDCWSPDYPDIRRLLPVCHYEPVD